MDPERLARLDGEVDREILEMRLGELRKYVGELTQAEVAELLGVTQGAISQLEKRQDTLLSRLAEYVRVLGGRLELVAHFEGRKPIRITQFEGVREEIAQRALSE